MSNPSHADLSFFPSFAVLQHQASALPVSPSPMLTIPSYHPKHSALAFSAILAADRGWSSEVLENAWGYVVLVSDGRLIQFVQSIG